MSWSFGINIAFCIIGSFGAWLDHGDSWTEYKAATGKAKKRRKLGKVLVMWGGLSLAWLALPFTYSETISSEKSAAETRQIATNALHKADVQDPYKMPVMSANAFVRLEISKDSTLPAGGFDPSTRSFNRIRLDFLSDGTEIGKSGGIGTIPMTLQKVEGQGPEYFLEFAWHLPLVGVVPGKNITVEELLGAINRCEMQLGFIGKDEPFEIIKGSIEIKLNALVEKEFLVPPQKPNLFGFVIIVGIPSEKATRVFPQNKAVGNRTTISN